MEDFHNGRAIGSLIASDLLGGEKNLPFNRLREGSDEFLHGVLAGIVEEVEALFDRAGNEPATSRQT